MQHPYTGRNIQHLCTRRKYTKKIVPVEICLPRLVYFYFFLLLVLGFTELNVEISNLSCATKGTCPQRHLLCMLVEIHNRHLTGKEQIFVDKEGTAMDKKTIMEKVKDF